MSEPKPTYKAKGRGRPANGDYPVKIFARVSEDDAELIKTLGKGSVSNGVRALCELHRTLIAADMARPRSEPSP